MCTAKPVSICGFEPGDMSSLLLSAASGAIFGSALTASGVYLPNVIVSQMKLTDFHMLKAFLTASACSALIIALANYSGYAKLNHRTDSSYGWFMKYDANVVGGLILGAGMSLTGSCPGTVLVQMGLGFKSGWEVAVGCLLGGIAFVKLGPRLKRSKSRPDTSTPTYTIQQKIGLSTSSTILTYELLCLFMIIASIYLAPAREYWLNPIFGGLLIGVAQTTSVLFTRKTLGVSSGYEDMGKYFWSVLGGSPRPGLSSIVFATGILAGARIISQFVPVVTETGPPVSTAAAIVGGAAMIFGARLAGGCTSGHGISGMSTMSLSSFVTVGSMFAGGITTALLLC